MTSFLTKAAQISSSTTSRPDEGAGNPLTKISAWRFHAAVFLTHSMTIQIKGKQLMGMICFLLFCWELQGTVWSLDESDTQVEQRVHRDEACFITNLKIQKGCPENTCNHRCYPSACLQTHLWHQFQSPTSCVNEMLLSHLHKHEHSFCSSCCMHACLVILWMFRNSRLDD